MEVVIIVLVSLSVGVLLGYIVYPIIKQAKSKSESLIEDENFEYIFHINADFEFKSRFSGYLKSKIISRFYYSRIKNSWFYAIDDKYPIEGELFFDIEYIDRQRWVGLSDYLRRKSDNLVLELGKLRRDDVTIEEVRKIVGKDSEFNVVC